MRKKTVNFISERVIPSTEDALYKVCIHYGHIFKETLTKEFDVNVANIEDIETYNKSVGFVTLRMKVFDNNVPPAINREWLNANQISKQTAYFRAVSNYVNTGRMLLIIDTTDWPFSVYVERKVANRIYLFLKQTGIVDFKNVILLVSTIEASKEEHIFGKIVQIENHECALKIYNNDECNIEDKIKNFYTKNKTYRFLYLNHKERPHRLYLYTKFFTEIKNMYEHFAVSMCPERHVFSGEQAHYTEKEKKIYLYHRVTLRNFNYTCFRDTISRFYSKGTLPDWFYNSTLEDFVANLSSLTNTPGGSNTTEFGNWVKEKWTCGSTYFKCSKYVSEHAGIYIGAETIFFYSKKHAIEGNDYLYLTEKTFKSIAMKMPFIMYGQPFILRRLREYGYRTFSDFWDESYDEEIDPALRADKLVNTVKKLTELSDKEFGDLLVQTKDIVEYNYRVFKERESEREICDTISDFYSEKN
jgi:hypothetical protein